MTKLFRHLAAMPFRCCSLKSPLEVLRRRRRWTEMASVRKGELSFPQPKTCPKQCHHHGLSAASYGSRALLADLSPANIS